MADPHIKSPMDFWDYLTVIIYRSGFVLAMLAVLLLPYQSDFALKGLLLAGTMLRFIFAFVPQTISPNFPIFGMDRVTLLYLRCANTRIGGNATGCWRVEL